MEYRYYIYKQSLIPTNFNKYDFTQYDYLCEITNNSQWGLNIERNSDWFTVIRREFNGQISISGLDYNALISIEGDPYQYAVVIHRKCGGAYSEFWKGFFSYFDFKVDMDRCTLSFTPKVWDAYSPVFDQMEVDRNILAADIPNSVLMDNYEFPIEELIYTTQIIDSSGAIPLATWIEYAYNPTDYPAGNSFYIYQQNVTNFRFDNDLNAYIFDMMRIYRREFYINNGANPGGSWVLDPCLDGPGEIIPGVEYKWVRPYLDIPNPPANAAVYSYITSGFDVIQTLTNSVNSTINLNGGIYLNSVLDYYAQFFGLDYVSSFFYDSQCPMGGPTLELTMMEHISNLRGVAEVATRGIVKLKEVLFWIRDTFNAYWYIDSNGDFRIEHRKYFDFGLSYSYAITIELDMSSVYPTEVKNMRRYEWAVPELYKYERLEMSLAYLVDWTDAKIEYSQLSINNPDYKIKSVQWSSDIVGMIDNSEDLPKKGWALLDIEERNLGGVTVPFVRNANGSYSGILIPNARFSPANIYTNWWTYGRLLPYGLANGNNTQFHIEKLKQQEELTFPLCCQDIDFNGVFRTPLGDGIIDKAEYEAKTGNLKINLIYE